MTKFYKYFIITLLFKGEQVMQNEISKRRVDKYNKKKLELERLKYELFGIVPKYERRNKRILKKK